MLRNRARSPSRVTGSDWPAFVPASCQARASPEVPTASATSATAARRDEGTLGPHVRGLALETSDGERDVVDRRDLLEHLGRNADPEARLDVGNEFHDAQTVQTEIVLNVVRRTDFSAIVHMTAQQIAKDLERFVVAGHGEQGISREPIRHGLRAPRDKGPERSEGLESPRRRLPPRRSRHERTPP